LKVCTVQNLCYRHKVLKITSHPAEKGDAVGSMLLSIPVHTLMIITVATGQW